MKKKRKYILLMLFILAFFIISIKYFQELIPTYKDRDRWEKTGKIIWEVPTSHKLIALTFDDGPSPTFTPQIIDLLKRYKAKATFFVTGKQAEKFPHIVKATASQGHSIGNHMYQHQLISKLSLQALIDDLSHAHKIIMDTTGTEPHFFRPPDGYYDETIVKAAEALKYQVVIWTWTQDTRDWSGISGTEIADKVITNAKPGDIILLHDQGGDRSNTVEALELLLPALTEEGYNFVTLDELVKVK